MARQGRCLSVIAASLCLFNIAVAAPPLHAALQTLRPQPSAAQRLDLRLPTTAVENVATVFPSMSRRRPTEERAALQLPALGPASGLPRNSVADFAKRVRREGLPVARLWENNSALLHLGLNQKGKPGLWLVQKTH